MLEVFLSVDDISFYMIQRVERATMVRKEAIFNVAKLLKIIEKCQGLARGNLDIIFIQAE